MQNKAEEHWQSIESTVNYQLAIVIPAFNEADRIPSTLEEILASKLVSERKTEIIVVNDGSTDNTSEVVNKYAKSNQRQSISLIEMNKNCGKGAAVKNGVLASRAEKVLFLDADGSTPINEFYRLESALNDDYDIAIGSRAKPSQETKIETNWHRKFLGRCFNFFVNLLVLPGMYDTQCGFKLFKAEAAHQLFYLQKLDGFSFDIEILFLAKKLNFRTTEVAINWQNVEGSKVNLFLDAAKMFKDILLIRSLHK